MNDDEQDFRNEVVDLLVTSQLIPAVKVIKSHYSIGLREAKDLLDEMREQAGRGGHDLTSPRRLPVVVAVNGVLDAHYGAPKDDAIERLATIVADKVWEKLAARLGQAVADQR